MVEVTYSKLIQFNINEVWLWGLVMKRINRRGVGPRHIIIFQSSIDIKCNQILL